MNLEFDIKEVLVDIKHGINKLETKVDKIAENVSGIRTDLTRVEAEIKGDIHRLEAEFKGDIGKLEAELKGSVGILDQKVDGLTKRVDTQDFINRGVIVGLVLTILGGFAKIFGLVPR